MCRPKRSTLFDVESTDEVAEPGESSALWTRLRSLGFLDVLLHNCCIRGAEAELTLKSETSVHGNFLKLSIDPC